MLPRATVPVTGGSAVLTGGAPVTGPSVLDVAGLTLTPLVLRALTRTRMEALRSLTTSVQDAVVAPAMFVKPVPLSRCHWYV